MALIRWFEDDKYILSEGNESCVLDFLVRASGETLP